MLGLKLETDPQWARLEAGNIGELLTDHAWCEQKAASNAISLIVNFPEHSGLVSEMSKIAVEEMEHFGMVHTKILERGMVLGPERKDNYVNELYSFMRRGHKRSIVLADRLLFAAMVEARSCERFRVLAETLADEDLRSFYRELMISEAGHYTTFLGFARQYGDSVKDVNARWQEWLDHESRVIRNYGRHESIHG